MTTEREKIIALARECGVFVLNGGEVDCTFNGIKAFYHAVRSQALEDAAITVDHILKEGGGTYGESIRQMKEEIP